MNYRNKFYKKYKSTHTENLYGKTSIKDIEDKFKFFNSYFNKFLPENKNVKILDLGCGSGELIYWLKSKGFINVEGVDISEEQVKQARKLGIENVAHRDVFDFLRKTFGSYDLIFAIDLLEHFTKKELLNLGELINESLNKKGVFIAQTPNAENLLWGRLRHGDFTHDLSFTSQSIKQFLKVVGFSNVEVYPQRPVIHGVKSFIRYILWRIIELWPKFYVLIETGSSKGIFTQNLIVKAEK